MPCKTMAERTGLVGAEMIGEGGKILLPEEDTNAIVGCDHRM